MLLHPAITISMSRVLFERVPSEFTPVHGELIRKLQLQLGFPVRRVDGVFSSEVQLAVRKWQEENDLPVTGTIDENTWLELMDRPVPSLFDRSLQLTAAFEQNGFAKVEGNAHGTGLTWGILGFTWFNRQLQKLLQ